MSKDCLLVPKNTQEIAQHGYNTLPFRLQNLVNQLVLNIPKDEIYDAIVSEQENKTYTTSLKPAYRSSDNKAPNKRKKEEYISNTIRKNHLETILALKTQEIGNIYLDGFKKIMLEKLVTKELVLNKFLELEEKIRNELPKKEQVPALHKVYDSMAKIIEKQDQGLSQTNIQINNNIPGFEEK